MSPVGILRIDRNVIYTVRIDNLAYSNRQTQGEQRREWLRHYAPLHLQNCAALDLHALRLRASAASRGSVILGAGACTEIPLQEIARTSDEVALVDLDIAAMKQAWSELSSATLRHHMRLVEADISGGVSTNLARLLQRQDWPALKAQGAAAIFDAAALCLEQCTIADPPQLQTLVAGSFGFVLSSLVLSQLFSYPILDLLDTIQRVAPTLIGEQERHRRYQDAVQSFRTRIITAHLHLLRALLDEGGVAVLISDIRGFAFSVYGTDHDAQHRRLIPLVPRTFPELVAEHFTVLEEKQWEWITDLPEGERLGRGYEVAGYILQ